MSHERKWRRCVETMVRQEGLAVVSVLKAFMRRFASGAPIIAPPPKPMIAMPVAMPRRSGNHLIRVETGEM